MALNGYPPPDFDSKEHYGTDEEWRSFMLERQPMTEHDKHASRLCSELSDKQ